MNKISSLWKDTDLRSLSIIWLQHAWIGVAVTFAISLFLWVGGYLADFYSAEDFLLFNFAETHSFMDAIKAFFLEHGRFLEGVWWIGLYKVTGYEPAIQHFISLLLNIAVASLASFVLYRSSKSFQNAFFASGFLMAVFLNPFTVRWGLILSGDNSRISIMLFFGSIVFFQNWLLSGKRTTWAILGFLCFAVATFTYESIILMFPAVIFILMFMAGTELLHSRKAILTLAITQALTLLLPLIPLRIYEHFGITSHPALRGDGVLGNLFERLWGSLAYTLNLLYRSGRTVYLFADTPSLPLMLAGSLLVIVVVLIFLNSSYSRKTTDNPIWLVFFAVWCIYVSVFTYAFAYPSGALYVRFFAFFVYGVALLAMLIFSLAKPLLLRFFSVLIVVAICVSGIIEFQRASYVVRHVLDNRPEFDYLSLLEIVPRVQPNTHFVLVDGYLGTDPYRSCALALRMLYRDTTIGCVFLSDEEEFIYAERGENTLNSYQGGWIRNEKFIVVGQNPDGSRFIIPELNPDSSVDIEWLDSTPIRTDYSAFFEDREPLPTRMFVKLVERRR